LPGATSEPTRPTSAAAPARPTAAAARPTAAAARPTAAAARPTAAAGARPTSLVRRRAIALAPPRAFPVRPQQGRRPPVPGLIAVALVLLGLFAVAAGLGQTAGFSWPDLFRTADKPPPRAFPVLEPSRPTRLVIPAIGVEAPILGVGLADDGSVDVPPLGRHNEAGWFERGPTPGQFGPAVIVGHVDTRTGPSIFYELGRLRPGQRIEVTRRDRRVAVFEVNSVEHFGKQKLPVDRVYGDYSRPVLRLVTCGGKWLGGGAGYADNVIVFASLVASRKA
jgi:hypothetical protein